MLKVIAPYNSISTPSHQIPLPSLRLAIVWKDVMVTLYDRMDVRVRSVLELGFGLFVVDFLRVFVLGGVVVGGGDLCCCWFMVSIFG